ncbi:hypothetical protein E8E11_002524 [Didymella keratinophila]|nr:hypothetical protein E8E11_002524 [Didymella keratinophila]
MGYGLKLCHLPSPPSTPLDDNTTSRESTIPHADTKLGTALNDHVTLPAPPTSSESDGAWQDETYDVNMAQICATLRARGAVLQELIRNYKWFAEAVAVDALFPPGVPLSLGEICVYYPHHVRWQDVMFRLVQNDYRGQGDLS